MAREKILNEVAVSTNMFRSVFGLRSLSTSARLNAAAQEYAERMARDGFFDHHSPTGDGPGERISAMGYEFQECGENIAVGYGQPWEVMSAWITSPAHRANLMNSGYVEIGLGMAMGHYAGCEGECPFWVQELCLPDGTPTH